MFAPVIAALMSGLALDVAPPPPLPRSQPPQSVEPDSGPVRLEDVEVTGRPLDAMIRGFVNEVAAPNRGRGIARWEGQVCVGVANLRPEPAQYLIDRVSTVAEDMGLTPGDPGCTANVLIIATADPDGLTRQLVETRPRAFRMGGAGMDRGGSALRAFEASDHPVRWWQMSMPVDSETGERATRIPGDCRNSCLEVMDSAPVISVFAASRLSTQIVDNLSRTIVILDVNQVSRVSLLQLADYVAMIALAQIDPEADTSAYATILNVFSNPESAVSLTSWDQAYLKGLYDAERTRKNLRAGRSEIADSIRQAHRTAVDAEPN